MSKMYNICIQTIGQAYEDMQTQNQHLLQQLTDRDDFNIKVFISSLLFHFHVKAAKSWHTDWRYMLSESCQDATFYEVMKSSKFSDNFTDSALLASIIGMQVINHIVMCNEVWISGKQGKRI